VNEVSTRTFERAGQGGVEVIMRNGKLLPGMTIPNIAPPPDPHRNKTVQRMRDAWDMRIIAWEGVFPRTQTS